MGIQAQALQMDAGQEPPYRVIHPLDDVPEEKVRSAGLGHMHMTPAVRWSLLVLRGYLIAMGLLVFYRCIDIAGGLAISK